MFKIIFQCRGGLSVPPFKSWLERTLGQFLGLSLKELGEATLCLLEPSLHAVRKPK